MFSFVLHKAGGKAVHYTAAQCMLMCDKTSNVKVLIKNLKFNFITPKNYAYHNFPKQVRSEKYEHNYLKAIHKLNVLFKGYYLMPLYGNVSI